MNEFTELQKRLAQADKSLFLGRLCWYTVSDVTISHEKLVQALVANNLSAFLPRVPADSDAFRRVCSQAERKRVSTGDSDVYDNYLVRKIGKKDRLVAKIVRERVDARSEKLLFETEICTLTWIRDAASVDVDCNGSDPVAATIAQEIVAAYHTEKGTMNSYAVRELIRKVLMSVNATNVRGNGGGVYFVKEAAAGRVEDLERFAASLPGTVVVHSLPLLDDDKQRDMLRRAYEFEAVEEIDRQIGEIADLKKSGKTVSAQVVSNYIEALSKAQAKDKEYTELLQTSLDSAGARIKIFRRQCMELSAQVKE